MATLRLATNQKKADKNGLTLSIWDESGFSFSPNCGGTWAPVGETPILHAVFLEYGPGRHNHTGVGMITRTPIRHLMEFHDGFAVQDICTIFKGSACFEDFAMNRYGC